MYLVLYVLLLRVLRVVKSLCESLHFTFKVTLYNSWGGIYFKIVWLSFEKGCTVEGMNLLP